MFVALTACGAGTTVLLGLVRARGDLLRCATLGPLAGAAWVGVVAASLAAVGIGLGVAGLLVLTAATWVAAGVRLARAGARREPTAATGSSVLGGRLLAGAAAVLIAGLSVAAIAETRGKPLAEYDGWAMWGMKARALASLGSADPGVFASEAYARLHLEYPLLVPGLASLPLQIEREYASQTVVATSLALGLAGVLAFFGLAAGRVGWGVLLPYVAAISATPAFFLQLQTGYADVPLAVFVAGGLVAAARWLDGGDTHWLGLATLFLAAAILTKNEGLLFATGILAPLLMVAQGRRRAVVLSGLAVLVAYAPWRTYTAVHDLGSPDYDLSASFDLGYVASRLDRAPVAARELLEVAVDPRRFGIALALGLAALVVAVAVGRVRLAVLVVGFALLSFAGLVWVYVLTPHDLELFLGTNADRVVVPPLLGLLAVSPFLVGGGAAASTGGEPGPVGAPR